MNAVSDPSTPEEDDASVEVSAEQPSEAFDKGGNYTVCFKLPYWYFDADRGEDFLTGQSGGLSGYEPGRYMLAVLMNSSGQWIWAGNLSAAGCTTAVNHPNGTYSAWITTSLHRPASDVVIDVTNDESKTFDWGAQNYTISGAGGTINIWLVGSSSVSNGAAAAANSLFRSTTAYLSGARIDVFVDEPCPGSTPGDTSGCTIGSQIWLGPNNDGLSRAGFKVVVNHELGHAVQNDLFGPLDNTYTITTNEDLCRCDHVEASGNSHCLQSRHFSWAAQGEGWGHAFAASNLNNSAQNDCTFVYYKEFQNEDGSETQPPMPKSCFSQVRWMENHCQLGGHGTEWDWMNFFWRLRNRDTYSYANFASVYEDACGGTCSGDSTTWTTLQASAEDVFGEGAVKALAWENQGNNFGVNH